jgi:hypothetical protein
MLKITAKSAKDETDIDDSESEWTTLITNADGIISIIQTIWALYIRNPDFGKDLLLVLNFRNNFTSRRSSLVDQILLPWASVQAFKNVSLLGNIEADESEYLQNHMAPSSASLQNMFAPADTFFQKGDNFKKQNQY